MKPPEYDFVFAGGGLAGLSLACQLKRGSLADRSILIIDPDDKQRDDRTFSFWSRQEHQPGPFDAAICKSWSRLAVHAPGYDDTLRLGAYRYHTIRGLDFYRQAHQELDGYANVGFLHERVERLDDTPDGVVVHTGDREIQARWGFDSRFHPPAKPDSSANQHTYLRLTFRGWEVETEAPVFDPGVATLMDFRTPQINDVRFFYVLPFDARHALVEYTLFTGQHVDAAAVQTALESYLQRSLGLDIGRTCQVQAREGGSLPVTDQPYPRKLGEHILAIGVSGGRLKPSTGYAYARVQRDAQAIAASLIQQGHPFALPADSASYGYLDSIMLEVMARHAERIPVLFGALFKNNPPERILRFLDEDASLAEVVQVMGSLPPGLFLKIVAKRGFKFPALRIRAADPPLTVGKQTVTSAKRRVSPRI